MPELPDVTIYVEALQERVVAQTLRGVRLFSPFVLRTASPPLAAAAGRRVTGVRRLGKRVVLELEGDLALVLHLMIAGRLQWRPKPDAKAPGRIGLAAFDFELATLLYTEASTKKRASLHVVEGADAAQAFHPGGLEPLAADRAAFAAALRSENRTLKRALTDQGIISGIGNAYSDEILHRARLSPVTLTSRLDEAMLTRLYTATQAVLGEWVTRLRAELGGTWPAKVTAFRPDMAVHGRFGLPCPACGQAVQRIAYAENEANYCPTCQTDGRLLADRALSKLYRGDWPKTLAELEERKRRLKDDE